MSALYAAVVAEALGVPLDLLNMEGACVLGESLRWFHRGMPSAGWPTASVDLPLGVVLDTALGRARPEDVPVRNSMTYELGDVDEVGLAITDAVALPGDAVLVSAAAKDSNNARDDGPGGGVRVGRGARRSRRAQSLRCRRSRGLSRRWRGSC